MILCGDAGIAQVVEQKTENLRVGGSTPSPGTIFVLGFFIF